jgi:hypothetical protein
MDMDIHIDHVSPSESVLEGVFVAMPLCFPTQSIAPPAGETAINVLLQSADGRTTWLGTAGCKAHVMAAAIHGLTGAVRDAGTIPDAGSIAGLMQDVDAKPDAPNVYAVACGAAGSSLWKVEAGMSASLIQEWGWMRPLKPQKVCDLFAGVAVAHAVPTRGDGKTMAGVAADGRVFTVDAAAGKVRVIGQVAGPIAPFSRVVMDHEGCLWGADAACKLWTCDLEHGRVETTGLAMPVGNAAGPRAVTWAADESSGLLYGGVDPDAMLFSVDPRSRTIRTIGKVSRLEGLGCLAVSHDGRVFGQAGLEEDIAHVFCYDPEQQTLRNLGVATSVLNARQYGYHFRCAATGAGGELYFGQYERVNHLWVYFQATPRRR